MPALVAAALLAALLPLSASAQADGPAPTLPAPMTFDLSDATVVPPPDASARVDTVDFTSAQAVLPFNPLNPFAWLQPAGAYGLGRTQIGTGGLGDPVWPSFGSTFFGRGPGYGCRGTVGCNRRGVNVGFGPRRGSIYSPDRGFDD